MIGADTDAPGPRSVTTRVEVSSRLAASAEEVWARVTTPEGIAEELRPWLRMTVPPALRGASIETVPLGQPLGRAWLLLGGVLPVDYDDLTLTHVSPGHFVEESRMASSRTWRHERRVEPSTGGSCVVDLLTVEPRRPIPLLAARRVVRLLFAHRHRRLRARFGAAPPIAGEH